MASKSPARIPKNSLELLRKENSELRKHLKDLSERFDQVILSKTTKKPSIKNIKPTIQQELINTQKILQLYKKEKKILKDRLSTLKDTNYEDQLSEKVEKLHKHLENLEKTKKNTEISYKKLSSLSPQPDPTEDYNNMLFTKYNLIKKIDLTEQLLSDNIRISNENKIKISNLEKKLIKLEQMTGDYLDKKIKQTQLNKSVNNKSRKQLVLANQINSKSTVLISKIKGLEVKLRFLKDDENNMSTIIKEKSMIALRMKGDIDKKIRIKFWDKDDIFRSTSVEHKREEKSFLDMFSGKYDKR
ncbi:hypothetical protein SteCoe_19462 [Stentor coeruleus]|uniref:Uncharacterized protein n=1 Tax=Stentor coeruleus TaxID=5963 RepID=A0A1R2BU27_9CILI|nr:hypothetical protein SteCoe_19462 [Stentor coeruleus]